MIRNIKKFQIILLGLFIANIFLAYNTPHAFAQAPPQTPPRSYKDSGVQDQIKTFLCTPSDATVNSTAASGDLYNCINKIYRFALVLTSVFAVFMIVVAGWIYMSAAGNEESVTKAKNILETSIVALVILFSGYILLRFINPDLIKFQPIQPKSVTDRDLWSGVTDAQLAGLFEQGTGGVNKSIIGQSGIGGCGGSADGSACADYTKAPYNFTGNSTQKPGQNTFLAKTLLEKLQKLKGSYPNFVINEAYKPTGDHSSKCHNDGSCADIGVNARTAPEVNKLCQAIKSSGSGIGYLNEYTAQNSGYNESQMPNCSKPLQTSKATGGHLHIQ